MYLFSGVTGDLVSPRSNDTVSSIYSNFYNRDAQAQSLLLVSFLADAFAYSEPSRLQVLVPGLFLPLLSFGVAHMVVYSVMGPLNLVLASLPCQYSDPT